MRAFARRRLATADVVAPQALQAEMRELAFIANGGIDVDNIADGTLHAGKFALDTFNQIKRNSSVTDQTLTLNDGEAIGQWLDVPNDDSSGPFAVQITTQDCFLQIETNAKWLCEYAAPEQSKSLRLAIFVDGGLVALSPPSGTSGDAGANLGYGHAYLNGQTPVKPGLHVVKLRWIYVWNGAMTVDMDVTFKARQLWVREVRR